AALTPLPPPAGTDPATPLLCRRGAGAAVAAVAGDAGCRLLTVADLFDRVIRHSGRIHSLATALCEKRLPPRDNELGKSARKCHTSGMLTPNGTEYAQKIPVRGDCVSAEQKLRKLCV
uniref:Uncharacterized protein n=1 Tax=Otus sunia TaxID=257818 RepID=A0A8C8B046_9STRI